MSNELFELLGLDAESAEAQAAREDDSELANLMRCLYQVRRHHDLSQSEVASRMGTTQSAVSDLERTSVDPHITTLQRYARAVGAALRLRLIAENNEWRDAGHVRARSVVRPSARHQRLVEYARPRIIEWSEGDGAQNSA